jgi:hypothetical protein
VTCCASCSLIILNRNIRQLRVSVIGPAGQIYVDLCGEAGRLLFYAFRWITYPHSCPSNSDMADFMLIYPVVPCSIRPHLDIPTIELQRFWWILVGEGCIPCVRCSDCWVPLFYWCLDTNNTISTRKCILCSRRST